MNFRFLKKEIKRNIVGYVIIVVMTLVGVGFLSGIFSCLPDMKKTVNDYYKETNFHDIKITSTRGFLEDDVREIEKIESLDKIQPIYSLYALSSVNGAGNYAAYVKSVDRSMLETNAASIIDMPVLIEGSYPTNSKSCLAVVSNALDTPIKIGDRVALLTNTDSCIENTFTVTGLVNTPEFTSNIKENASVGGGKAEIIIYVSQEIFIPDANYNEILCTLKDTQKLSAFDDKYTQKAAAVQTELTELGKKRSDDFAQTVNGQYQDDLNKAQKHYEYIKGQTEEDLKTLSSNIKELETTITELETNITAEEKEVQRLKEKADALNKIQTGDETQETNTVPQDVTDENSDVEEVTSEAGDIQDNSEDTSKSEETETSSEISHTPKAPTEYDFALKQYEDANGKLEADKKDLEDKKKTCQTLKREYYALKNAAGDKIEDAEHSLGDFDGEPDDSLQKWLVNTRNDNISFNSFLMNAGKINTVSGFFPVIFFIVAVGLVLTLMNRLLNKQRKELGIWQSLGYSDRAITLKYILYAFSATVIGGVLGIACGVIIIPKLVFKTYSVFYNYPQIKLVFRPLETLGALLIEGVLVLGLTVFICSKMLKGSPAELLRPQEAENKKIFLQKNKKRWAKYSASKKERLKNIYGYKNRLIMMLVGFIGCTALVLSAFGLNNSLNTIADKEYELRPFDAAITFEDEKYAENDAVNGFINNSNLVKEHFAVKQTQVSCLKEKNSEIATAVSINGDKFGEYYKIKGLWGDLKTNEESVIISQNLAKSQGFNKDDEIKLIFGNKTASVKITDICSGYIGNYIFLGKNVCPDFTKDFETTLLIKNGNTVYDKNEIASSLFAESNVSAAVFTADELSVFDNSADKLGSLLRILAAVAVLLCVSVALVTVIINFADREEKIDNALKQGKKISEIVFAVLKENLIITIAATLIGMIFGALLYIGVINMADMGNVMLSKSIGLNALIVSAILPILSIIAVTLAFYPLIKIKQKKTAL